MKVIVTGATGYVGEGILLTCLASPDVEEVLSVSRRPCGRKHAKLKEYIVPDLMQIPLGDPKLQGYDAVFFCAGISSVGISEEAYKVISHDIPLHFAEALDDKTGVTFIYVSGGGTSRNGKLNWQKVKASTEDALEAMPFKRFFAWRPGIMLPLDDQRNFTNFWSRAYKWTKWLWRLFPSMCNEMSEVGLAMIRAAQRGYKKRDIDPADIRELAKEG